MKIRLAVAAAILVNAGCLLAPRLASAQNGLGGTLNVFLGQKRMNKSDWKPVENQPQVGVETTIGLNQWPVAVAVDIMYSTGSGKSGGVNVKGTTTEVDLGVRTIFKVSQLRPQVGGGLVLLGSGEKSGGGQKASDSSFGIWANFGMTYSFGNAQVGADVRYSTYQLKDGPLEADGGGLQIGLIGGVSF